MNGLDVVDGPPHRLGSLAARSAATARWEGRLEDLEMLLGAGEPVERICQRLGVQPWSLNRQLYRRRRGDLARRLGLWRWSPGRPVDLIGMPAAPHRRGLLRAS